MANSAPRVVRILAFGDSLTEGHTLQLTHFHPYTHRLQELLRGYNKSISFQLDNFGITGEFVQGQMSARLPKILKDNGPYDLVIILGGSNDLSEFTLGQEKELFEEIRNLHLTSHRHGAKTMLLTIPESDYIFEDMGKDNTSYIKEQGEKGRILVNAMLRSFANETSDDVILCDLAKEHPHSTLSKEDKSKYWDDGLHYTPEGYNRMGEIVFDKLKHLYSN